MNWKTVVGLVCFLILICIMYTSGGKELIFSLVVGFILGIIYTIFVNCNSD